MTTPIPQPKRAIFTICSWNYMGYALTLVDSILSHNDGVAVYVFVADRENEADLELPTGAKLVLIDETIVPRYLDMAMRYDIMEFNTSVKPFCFQHLFRSGHENIIYLDPDIYLLDTIQQLFDDLKVYDCLLTPHILQPLPDDGMSPDNLAILKSGTYNLGFLGLSNCGDVRPYLEWWACELTTNCVSDVSNGLFVDQRFCEFIPSFLSKVRVPYRLFKRSKTR